MRTKLPNCSTTPKLQIAWRSTQRRLVFPQATGYFLLTDGKNERKEDNRTRRRKDWKLKKERNHSGTAYSRGPWAGWGGRPLGSCIAFGSPSFSPLPEFSPSRQSIKKMGRKEVIAGRWQRLPTGIPWSRSDTESQAAPESAQVRIRRKFGGYRIAPKSCKDLTSHGKGTGLCMFNYECSKKNGTVVGSCMDGFLFGACCRLPPGTNFISMEIPSKGTVTQRTTTTTLAEVISSSTGSSTVHSPAETVLFHENGTVANEIARPEDFDFNSNPELFVATDATQTPPNRQSTNPQKSTMWKSSTTESWLTTKVRPAWTSLSEENFVKIPTISSGSSTQDSDSINHILSILEDQQQQSSNSPSKETAALYGGEPTTPPSFSTWVSVDSKTPSNNYPTTTPLYQMSYVSKTPQQPNIIYSSSSSPHVTQYYPPPQSTVKPYYSSPKPTVKPTYATHKPQYSTYKPIHLYSPSPKPPSTYTTTLRPDTYQTVDSQHLYYSSERPPQSTYTTLKPTTIYTQKPQTSYTKKPTTTLYSTYPDKKPIYPNIITKKPTTTTQFVQGPGFQVSITPKPVQTTPEPPPTVIVLGPVHPTKKPVQSPIGTIITVNPDGDVVTYKPAAAATAKPIYHGVSHGPLFTTIKPEVTTLGTTGTHSRPTSSYSPSYTSPTQVIKDNLPNTTELFAFPPVRDPYVNLTHTHAPEVVHWNTPSLGQGEEDETTPPLVEDENLDNKVHKFVEKIVQSLQGNFEDLENVLIDGQSTNNVTISSYPPPVKRPSTTTRKPTRKPSKKPTTYYQTTYRPTTRPRPTLPLITRPPSRPSPTKKPYTTKRPSSPTTTIFSEETNYQSTSEVYSTPELDYKRECGVRPLMKNGRIVGGKGATFGEWPWQVLVREATWLGLFTKNKCGGVLITNKFVITAAHCQPGFLASLIAVFGEYDISGELESKRSSTRNVKRVIVHRHYDAATFENDIALLELELPIQYDQHIVPICMPEDDEDFTGKMATVTGWGRLKYGGGVPSVLQEVQVPVMENNVCQEMFHTAGHSKTILQSFVCAGYANGQRDSCEGDSGGPLMIERPNGHWVLAGTVSHGIKCAAPYLPGVYMRTTYYKPWLETITGVRNW
ncbi:unnamed protein product [Nesidiocoris tenuis]|uniref:Peptidase S1 domain-containing protein n=1 Tax=Nesidiocoris tenuis TaxID=355587 RepID=A0A6H5FTJ2_9HEMI|nr:unnamed protein product [Nesidiocoris tenuis]